MSIPSGKRPTLKTISQISGFAVPTVSRALKGAPDIKRDTIERVRQIAADIGYVPNRAGVRLKTGRTNVISLILSTEHDMMNHTARLISSVAGALRNTPFHLNVTPYFPDQDPMEPVRYVVETGSADAIILNQTEPQDPRVAFLMERGFPFVTHGRTDWAQHHAYYDFDNHEYACNAARYLVGRGRKNLLLIAPPVSQSYARHTIAGAQDGAGSAMSVSVLTNATGDSSANVIQTEVTKWLRKTPDTDGILCMSANATMAVVAALEDCGRTLGQDIDVVAKEAVPFLHLFRPELTVYKEDVARAGDFLGRAAMQVVNGQGAAPMQELDRPALPI